MKSSKMNSKKKHGLKGFILVIGACLAVLAAGSGVNAASCIDLADIPLDALEQAAPGLIMFVLDDSGSMDWSFMTPPGSPGESDGLFKGYYYVFSNPGDDVYNAPNLEDNAADRMIWMSQWSGYNGMYYNPGTEYTPWPTFGNADVDYPRSSPTTVGNTLDMTETNLWHQWGTVGVVVDNNDAGLFGKCRHPHPRHLGDIRDGMEWEFSGKLGCGDRFRPVGGQRGHRQASGPVDSLRRSGSLGSMGGLYCQPPI